ncbi:MAG: multiheme c-type cytochrome [bacterium]
MYKRILCFGLPALFIIFMIYRFVRPLSIFVVTEYFERPIQVGTIPPGLESLSAKECGRCHREIYEEWSGSMHAHAWTDPYFQVDFVFDGSLQICLNCHIPLENQQENLVLGFRDREKLDPILKPNPNFDPLLQKEGVTCSVCHVANGVILGPYNNAQAPHPVRKDPRFTDGNGVCLRCHMVLGQRWDTFYRIPPCGTFAEIRETGSHKADCIGCHMPKDVKETIGVGDTGHSLHLWKGGHDPETIRKALRFELREEESIHKNRKRYSLTLTNTGADHFLPTGTPDRHLTVTFDLLDSNKKLLTEKTFVLKRTIMWRPFIIDLWDTRLPRDEPRNFDMEFRTDSNPPPAFLKIAVTYHLLDEKRRTRIGYQNKEPISYQLYERELEVR